MVLFNRFMALAGFTAILGSAVGLALANTIGSGAVGWVIEISSHLAAAPPLSF